MIIPENFIPLFMYLAVFMILKSFKNKVGKPTSTPLPLNLEGLGHFAAPDAYCAAINFHVHPCA
jgi:hypothetical protein